MKSLTGAAPLMFALTLGMVNVVFAEQEASQATRAARETALGGPDTATRLADACKGKKPGAEMAVDGKKLKCPAEKRRQFNTLSNASKTKHDTVKNSINNVR